MVLTVPGPRLSEAGDMEKSRKQSSAKNTLAEGIQGHLPHPGNVDLTLKVRSWEL